MERTNYRCVESCATCGNSTVEYVSEIPQNPDISGKYNLKIWRQLMCGEDTVTDDAICDEWRAKRKSGAGSLKKECRS
jgi:hypothetical protein